MTTKAYLLRFFVFDFGVFRVNHVTFILLGFAVAARSTAAQKLGEKMYAKQQAEAGAAGADASGAAGGAEASKDDGDVVDAEYTEVKDKK